MQVTFEDYLKAFEQLAEKEKAEAKKPVVVTKIKISDEERAMLKDSYEDFMECLLEGNWNDANYYVCLLREILYSVKRNNGGNDE